MQFIFLLLLLIAIIAISSNSAFAADHVVLGSNFEDIKDTIDGSSDNDRILLGNKTYTSSGSQIRVVNKFNIVVQGRSDSERAVLDARHLSRIFVVDEDSTVTFKYIDFINGDVGASSGAAINTYNTIIIENCSFRNNWGESGGAIFIRQGADNSRIVNSSFINNEGRYEGTDEWVEGGAVDIHANFTSIIDCVFTGNNALDVGGAVNFASNTIGHKLIGSTFRNNYAPTGGAIRSNNDLLIEDCFFIDNYANETNGGALYLRLINIIIKNCVFTNNHAVRNGGAIYDVDSSSSGYLNITNTKFNNNYGANGGAIYSESLLNITYCNFTSNRANNGNTGGIYSSNTKLIVNNNFSNNMGIAISIRGTGTTVSGNNLTNNSEHAVRSSNLQNAIINNNHLINNKGTALYISGNGNKVYNNVFSGNNIGVNINGDNTNFTKNLVLNTKANGVFLTGNNINFASNNISSNAGHGLLLNGNNPIISNNIFSGNNYGVNGQLLSNGLINNNNFSNNRGTGFYAKGSNNRLYNNNFSNNKLGVNVVGDTSNFKDNNVKNNILQGVIFIGNYVYIGSSNFTGNKRNAIKITGNYATIEKNLATGNSINSAGNCVILISGGYAKVRYNTVKNNNFRGIRISGTNAEVKYNILSKNIGGELLINGNKAKIQRNNVSYGRGNGIYLVGKSGDISYNNVHHNNNVGIAIRGNLNKVYKNTANYNKAQGLYFRGNNSKITDNNFNYNLKSGIKGEGNKNLIRKNNIFNNSKKGSSCAIFFKGNYNNYTSNKIYNNGYHGLHISGKNNRVVHNILKYNKNTQGVIVGNNNYLYNLTVYTGSKTGLGVYGNQNKILKSKIYKNKNHGLTIKGNLNKLNKTIIYNNKNVGIVVKGSKNKFLQNTIKSNRIGIHHKTGSKNYYNYNFIVNTKYNLYRVKGSINAEYNWWGGNKKAKIKNSKINKYVTAYLTAPNTLKLKKAYNINVKFKDNKKKKLKLNIPSLKVKFSFTGVISPLSYTVTKNIAKAKIKVNQYGYYKLIAKVDNQKLYKYYIGDSKGKVYDLKVYISMLLKKEGVKANKALVNSLAKKANKNANEANKAEHKTYLSLRDYLSKSLKNMSDGPGKWFLGMILTNMPKYSLNQFIKAGGLQSLFSQGPLGFLANYYMTGKIQDANKKNNGDLLKILGDSFIKIYGYSNINKVEGSEIWKTLLEIGVGIDKNGSMSIGDTLLNLAAMLLTFGLGGVVPKLGKSALTAISKIFPKTVITTATQLFKGLTKTITKFGDNYLSKFLLDFFSDYSLRKGIVDVSKMLSGDFTDLLKQISKIPQLKGMDPVIDAINIYKKGFSGLVGYLSKNVLSKIPGLKKIATFLNIRSDLNAVKKGVGNSVNKIIKSVKSNVKSVASKIKAAAKKTYSAVKSVATKIYNTVKSGVTKVYSAVKSVATKVYSTVKSGVNWVVNKLKFW
jgi:parallel beta-helix repeat protein/predicted outer membrane repeat protein